MGCVPSRRLFLRSWWISHRNLAFTRFCYCQYFIVYSIHTRGRKGSRIRSNNRAIVLHQGGKYWWAGGEGWLIRAQQPRGKRISCKGQIVILSTILAVIISLPSSLPKYPMKGDYISTKHRSHAKHMNHHTTEHTNETHDQTT